MDSSYSYYTGVTLIRSGGGGTNNNNVSNINHKSPGGNTSNNGYGFPGITNNGVIHPHHPSHLTHRYHLQHHHHHHHTPNSPGPLTGPPLLIQPAALTGAPLIRNGGGGGQGIPTTSPTTTGGPPGPGTCPSTISIQPSQYPQQQTSPPPPTPGGLLCCFQPIYYIPAQAHHPTAGGGAQMYNGRALGPQLPGHHHEKSGGHGHHHGPLNKTLSISPTAGQGQIPPPKRKNYKTLQHQQKTNGNHSKEKFGNVSPGAGKIRPGSSSSPQSHHSENNFMFNSISPPGEPKQSSVLPQGNDPFQSSPCPLGQFPRANSLRLNLQSQQSLPSPSMESSSSSSPSESGRGSDDNQLFGIRARASSPDLLDESEEMERQRKEKILNFYFYEEHWRPKEIEDDLSTTSTKENGSMDESRNDNGWGQGQGGTTSAHHPLLTPSNSNSSMKYPLSRMNSSSSTASNTHKDLEVEAQIVTLANGHRDLEIRLCYVTS